MQRGRKNETGEKRGKDVAAHTSNSNTWEAEAGDLYEFQTSLIYTTSSRLSRIYCEVTVNLKEVGIDAKWEGSRPPVSNSPRSLLYKY